MDIAAHIIEAKWIWLEAADLQRLGRLVGLIAAFTIGHRGQGQVAPPKLTSCSPTGRILPFGFGRKPKWLLRDLGEPFHKLLRIIPGPLWPGLSFNCRHVAKVLRLIAGAAGGRLSALN